MNADEDLCSSVLVIRKSFAGRKGFFFAKSSRSWRSSRLRGESWAGLSPRRREAREENAKDFSLVAALLLCVHPCSSVVSFSFFSCGSVGRATTPYLADIHQQTAELTGFHS